MLITYIHQYVCKCFILNNFTFKTKHFFFAMQAYSNRRKITYWHTCVYVHFVWLIIEKVLGCTIWFFLCFVIRKPLLFSSFFLPWFFFVCRQIECNNNLLSLWFRNESATCLVPTYPYNAKGERCFFLNLYWKFLCGIFFGNVKFNNFSWQRNYCQSNLAQCTSRADENLIKN